jgi:hypothetical protein
MSWLKGDYRKFSVAYSLALKNNVFAGPPRDKSEQIDAAGAESTATATAPAWTTWMLISVAISWLSTGAINLHLSELREVEKAAA